MRIRGLIVSVFIVFIAILYIFTLRGIGGNIYPQPKYMNQPPFETSMERGRFAQIVSMAEHASFNVDRFSDFLKPDLAWYSGHYYSAFPPGVAAISVPFYILGKSINLSQVASFAVSALFAILTTIVIYRIGRKFGLRLNSILFGMLIFAIGSVVWAYGVTLSAHTVSAFLLSVIYPR